MKRIASVILAAVLLLTGIQDVCAAEKEGPGGRAEINEGENRLQLFFDEKPTEEQRQELKHNGFKWAPSQGAWQRQLNRNAIFAAGRMDFLRTADGQSPVQLQPFARREREEPSR